LTLSVNKLGFERSDLLLHLRYIDFLRSFERIVTRDIKIEIVLDDFSDRHSTSAEPVKTEAQPLRRV